MHTDHVYNSESVRLEDEQVAGERALQIGKM